MTHNEDKTSLGDLRLFESITIKNMLMLFRFQYFKNDVGCLLLFLIGLILLAAPGRVVASSSPNKKLFLSANWKGSLETPEEVDDLIQSMNTMWKSLSQQEKVTVELCVHPPYCFIDRVRRNLSPEISVGSQNVFDARGPNQANTGAVTTNMLSNIGCDWVLLGHSDRRNNLGETDELIGHKLRHCLDQDMGVILTIGELASQRRWGRDALTTLKKQLKVAATTARIQPNEWSRIVIAYEPVWAVGEGATPCSPQEAQRVHQALRDYITQLVTADAAASCRLTYTGSVSPENAASYAQLKDVDGFVVGRAGLDTTKLQSIIQTLTASSSRVS